MRFSTFITSCLLAAGSARAAPQPSRVGAPTEAEITAMRIQFLESAYNQTVTPAMVENVSSGAIRQLSATLAEKSQPKTAKQVGLTAAAAKELEFAGLARNHAGPVDPATNTAVLRSTMYAAAAYCFKWHFNWNWNCNERCTNGLTDGTKMVDYFFKDSTTGFVAYNDAQKSVIVSFRGTLGPLNFFRDLQLNVVPLDIGKTGGITPPPSDARVHNGFQITLEVARERVRKAVAGVLANPARANYAVTVVGHSLGGAIATLASIDLKDFLGNKNTVNAYTFGAPRVGNEAFAKWVDSLPITISRITALHDPIPTVPRREWYPLNYQHANTEFYTDAGKTINKCTEPANGDEPADCLNGEPDLIGRDIASLLTPVWIFWHLNNYAKTVFGPWC